VFAGYTAIVDACQNAWRRLLNEPGRIASIATRDWAMIGQIYYEGWYNARRGAAYVGNGTAENAI
jgi:hypothetical protein